MPRYFSRPSIVPDELIVGGHRLAGEDPRALAIATALRAAARTGADPTPVLLEQGVGWLVVDREAGGPSPRDLVPQLTELFSGPSVTIYRVPGTPAEQEVRPWAVILILAAWAAAGVVLAAAILAPTFRRTTAGSRL